MIVLNIHGVPRPQGSKQAFVRNGRAVVVNAGNTTTRQNLDAWRQAVARAAADHTTSTMPPALLDGPVAVTVEFWLPRPKSLPKRRRWPDRKPDLDKLVRAVFDALTQSGLIADDARIVELNAAKHYAHDRTPPGARIAIREIV